MQDLTSGPLSTFVFFIPIIILFYFLIMRPQQQQAKRHQAMVTGIKRGDSVVLSNGMVGKVIRVEDAEAMVEISQGVAVPVIKTMIADVRAKGEPAKVADKSAKSAKG
jgi:preprotein translocase subunit YajC